MMGGSRPNPSISARPGRLCRIKAPSGKMLFFYNVSNSLVEIQEK
jgi:hypothetical protein